jgi:DNA-binding response OmpR family regulator
MPVGLTVKEFTLLEFLLQHQGSCCSRVELLREVWQMTPETGTNVVDVYVNYVRRKLAAVHPAGDAAPVLIETVRGIGYVLGEAGSAKRRLPERKGPQRAEELRALAVQTGS